ncbi:hypothetical protein AWB67_06261 [Caballeronia terrestris]|uniref:Uncharacterized protein n=1 Tax=Caballeronia terrestris TaxID=1226301 RepID=A0A158KP41_9BURK|nr:hypothetical protein AWB67_06261 [Caballeronia terrestris]
MDSPQVRFQGFSLPSHTSFAAGTYSVTLFIRAPNGLQRASELISNCPCQTDARKFAIEYGMAQIAERPLPDAAWA